MTYKCGSVPEGQRIEVDADPLGWAPPQSPTSVSQRELASRTLQLWLAGVAAIAVVVGVGRLIDGVVWIDKRRRSDEPAARPSRTHTAATDR